MSESIVRLENLLLQFESQYLSFIILALVEALTMSQGQALAWLNTAHSASKPKTVRIVESHIHCESNELRRHIEAEKTIAEGSARTELVDVTVCRASTEGSCRCETELSHTR